MALSLLKEAGGKGPCPLPARLETEPTGQRARESREPESQRASEPESQRARGPREPVTREPESQRARDPESQRTREPEPQRAREYTHYPFFGPLKWIVGAFCGTAKFH